MNLEANLRTFVIAIIVGMGFHIGWAVIGLLVALIAKSLGVNP